MLPRLALALVTAIYGLYCGLTPKTYHFLDGVDLLFHESGHFFLSGFGMFLHILGGTLGQLFWPSACIVYFIKTRQWFAAAVVVTWLGQNCFNIAIYMKDAVEEALPLVGGDMHDWHWLFTRLGLLSAHQVIGNLVYTTGFILLLISWGGMFYASLYKVESDT